MLTVVTVCFTGYTIMYNKIKIEAHLKLMIVTDRPAFHNATTYLNNCIINQFSVEQSKLGHADRKITTLMRSRCKQNTPIFA